MKKIKNFTELTLSFSDAGAIAQYMDEQISEEVLVSVFGNVPVVYGLIALNVSLNTDISYELLYAEYINKRPKKQIVFDKIAEALLGLKGELITDKTD